MDCSNQSVPEVPLRKPETVMSLARLGSFHQCRLSFMRTLLRRMTRERWTFERSLFDIDSAGVGTAIYSAHGPERTYSLVCFAHDLPADQRSDRVIAHAWDSTFTLFDGVPTEEDITRLSQNVPKQEAGRVTSSEISVSRANRSVRLFEHVVASLAAGHQPDLKQVDAVGYLMRTTAVYGSGKLGAADREVVANRPELAGPFQPEMLSVFLTRAYTLDLVEHLAQTRSPETAVTIDSDIRRKFGVGNATGLGLGPFIINHPVLFNNWITAREQALARVRSQADAPDAKVEAFRQIVARAQRNVDQWRSEHPLQVAKLADLSADLERINSICAGILTGEGQAPWDRLYNWAEENLSLEGQEQLVSMMLEPFSELVDELADQMSADESTAFWIDGAMPLNRLRAIVTDVYQWALQIDWTEPDNQAQAWYVSEEKLEPRIGKRFEEPIEPYEQPLAPGRDAAAMHADISTWDGEDTVAAFLLAHPQHRHIARRAQITDRFPYAEIRDNTISADLLPIDLLRCKLAYFGATHFDPRSDRWVRINMFRNAPFPNELHDDEDNWSYPPLQETNRCGAR